MHDEHWCVDFVELEKRGLGEVSMRRFEGRRSHPGLAPLDVVGVAIPSTRPVAKYLWRSCTRNGAGEDVGLGDDVGGGEAAETPAPHCELPVGEAHGPHGIDCRHDALDERGRGLAHFDFLGLRGFVWVENCISG